jgi:hypothetical protein
MNITERRKWTSLLLIGGSLLLAQGQEIKLNATRSEKHVLRKMVVVKTSGEKISTLEMIVSFDPATTKFVMKDVSGGTTSISSSEIREIDFEQAVEMARPAAQEAFWEVIATPGSRFKYTVPKGALRVDSGDLVLPASSRAIEIAGDVGNPPESPSRKEDKFSRINVVEPRRLTVDIAQGSFVVEVQNVIYTTKIAAGSSTPSGVAK